LIVFAWKISGSHFNPAITLAFMFRKDQKKFPIALGVAYICAQIIGAILAALLLVFFENGNIANLTVYRHCYAIIGGVKNYEHPIPCGDANLIYNTNYIDKSFYIRALTQEIIGTFIAVLFFMIQTDEKMFFSRERAINCFIIASGYVAARAMFYG